MLNMTEKETIDKITLILDVYHMSEESRLELTNLIQAEKEQSYRDGYSKAMETVKLLMSFESPEEAGTYLKESV